MLSESQQTKVNLKEHVVTWFGRLNYAELLSLIFLLGSCYEQGYEGMGKPDME